MLSRSSVLVISALCRFSYTRTSDAAMKCWRVTHSSSATLLVKTDGAHRVQWLPRHSRIKWLPLHPRMRLCKSFCVMWIDSATTYRSCHVSSIL